MKHICLLLFLVSNPAIVFANGFVGNGGDGVEFEGQVVVYDLFSFGAHKNPYFGAEKDPLLPELPSYKEMGFEYPKDLLQQKLTDLNSIAPGMGDYVLMTMKSYTWVLQDFPLTPIKRTDDPVILPIGSRLIQIANRLGMTIRIHKDTWGRLDDANKVALIVHESIFSLVRPTFAEGGYEIQSSRTAREIVGGFFEESLYHKNPSIVYGPLATRLSIPDIPIPLWELRKAPTWELSYRYNSKHLCEGKGPDCSPAVNVIFPTVDFSEKQSYSSLKKHLERFCSAVEEAYKKEPHPVFFLNSQWTPSSVRVEIGQYNVSPGRSQFQFHAGIVRQEIRNPSKISYPVVNTLNPASHCFEGLRAHFEHISLWAS